MPAELKRELAQARAVGDFELSETFLEGGPVTDGQVQARASGTVGGHAVEVVASGPAYTGRLRAYLPFLLGSRVVEYVLQVGVVLHLGDAVT